MQFNFQSLLAALLPLASVARACVHFYGTVTDSNYLMDTHLIDNGFEYCSANNVKGQLHIYIMSCCCGAKAHYDANINVVHYDPGYVLPGFSPDSYDTGSGTYDLEGDPWCS